MGLWDELFATLGMGSVARFMPFWCDARVAELDIEAHPRFNPRSGSLRLVCGLGGRVLRIVSGFLGRFWFVGCGWF